MEKTKLEIDSLRLHITEQRKRMEDWGGGFGGTGGAWRGGMSLAGRDELGGAG
ncbi:MAG: hypothetical protein Q8L55_03440 [Phycisphaerales bacterium]|nr:hypothetical protein [Phycisphaerales bacterium]